MCATVDHELVVTTGPDKGTSLLLDRPLIVGTGQAVDLRLNDPGISERHLLIVPRDGEVHVRALGAGSATWVGGLRLNDVVLTRSAELVIGETTLRVNLFTKRAEPVATRFGDGIAVSNSMRHVFDVLERAAPQDVTVLIKGESGVGKDVLANAVHRASARADGPFVALDCGAMPPNLIESELFGHERGAFTGADRPRDGAFVQADGGTLFLDEIGELPLEMQPKLLRALETREIRPVGGSKSRRVDVRIIAATNRDLKANEFRTDLYYRLAVLKVDVPALRERPEDVLLLARAFLERLPGANQTLSPALEARLRSYSWPGNVRELRNVISRYAVLGDSHADLFDEQPISPSPSVVDLSHLPYREARARALEQFERLYLTSVLERTGNVVIRAARHAGVARGSFHRMLGRIRSSSKDRSAARDVEALS